MNSSLPEGWSSVKLAEIADVVSGGTPSRDVAEFWAPADVDWVTPTDITKDSKRTLNESSEKISLKGLRNSSAKILPIGTILMTSRATLGEMKIAEIACCTNQGFKSLIVKPNVDNWFLYYQMKRKKPCYEKLGIGSTFLEVNKKDTDNFEVELAPFQQQKRIAQILSTVDNLINQTQNLIDKYTAVKQGMMADLFSRGIDLSGTPETNRNYGQLRPSYEEAPELYQETEIGWVPKDWSVRTVNDVADVTKLAGFEFTLHFNYVERGEIIALRALNIKNEKIDITNIQRIYQNVSDKLPRSKLYIGDIVFTYIGAYIGDAVIIDENNKYHLAPNICLIRPFQKKSAFFLFKQLRHEPLYRQMMSKTVTTATPSLTMTQIRTLKLAWPELTEQVAVEERLKCMDNQIENLGIKLKKYQKIKKGLMQDLLTGKVTV